MVGRICIFWWVLPAQVENSIPSSVCLSSRTHDFDRNTSSGQQLDVRWRWSFLFIAPDSPVFSVGGTSWGSLGVVRWGWLKCEHLFIPVPLSWFGPLCCSSLPQSLRLLGAICPIWCSREGERRFCSFLRVSPWRSLPGCSRCIPQQQAGSMPPMARSMSQWRWFGCGWWMGCRLLFGTWWALWWFWRGWQFLWVEVSGLEFDAVLRVGEAFWSRRMWSRCSWVPILP